MQFLRNCSIFVWQVSIGSILEMFEVVHMGSSSEGGSGKNIRASAACDGVSTESDGENVK